MSSIDNTAGTKNIEMLCYPKINLSFILIIFYINKSFGFTIDGIILSSTEMMLSIVEVEMNSQPIVTQPTLSLHLFFIYFCCSLQDTTYVFEILASIIDKKNTLIDHTSTNFVTFC